jgi:hypothetical protein
VKIDFGQPLEKAFQIDGRQRAEAWAESIAQCTTLGAVGALEDRLHRRLALLRDREAPNDVERNALALCAERRSEIAAAAAIRPGVTGNAHDAHSGNERQDHND